MSVPKAKKHKPLTSADYKKGRAAGVYETLILFFALVMQDDGWSNEKVAQFGRRVIDWQKYAHEPNLEFYISTVEKILKEQGIYIERDV